MDRPKYELASPEWRAFMHAIVAERLAQLGEDAKDKDWSFCEIFTDAPDHLQTDGTSAVWHCRVIDGTLTFGSNILDDATFTVTADYDAIVPLARFDTRDEPERQVELAQLSQALMEQGQMTLAGDAAGLDARVGSFHDAIAAVTA